MQALHFTPHLTHRHVRGFEESLVGEEVKHEPARGGGYTRSAYGFHEVFRRAPGRHLKLVQQHHRQDLGENKKRESKYKKAKMTSRARTTNLNRITKAQIVKCRQV